MPPGGEDSDKDYKPMGTEGTEGRDGANDHTQSRLTGNCSLLQFLITQTFWIICMKN